MEIFLFLALLQSLIMSLICKPIVFTKQEAIITSGKSIDLRIQTLNTFLYSVPIKLGQYGQTFDMIVDTQRSELSTFDLTVQAPQKFSKHQSSSYKVLEKNYNVTYNDRILHGELGADLLQIGNSHLKGFEFVLVSNSSDQKNFNIDGYFGLGFNKNKSKHIVKVMKDNGLISEAKYSLHLAGRNEHSLIHFGSINKTGSADDVNRTAVYVPVKFQDGYPNWYINAINVNFNNADHKGDYKMLIDSTMSSFLIPKNFFFEHAEKFFGEGKCEIDLFGHFKCNCSLNYTSVFPNFTIYFNQNESIHLSPQDYMSPDFATSDENSCHTILSLNYQNDLWIIGTNMLRDYHTIFDIENDKIGFVDNRQEIDYSGNSLLWYALLILFLSILFFTCLLYLYKKITNRTSRNEGEVQI